MPEEASSAPERPLGALRPQLPKAEPEPREWVGDVEIVPDEAD